MRAFRADVESSFIEDESITLKHCFKPNRKMPAASVDEASPANRDFTLKDAWIEVEDFTETFELEH